MRRWLLLLRLLLRLRLLLLLLHGSLWLDTTNTDRYTSSVDGSRCAGSGLMV